MLLAVVDGLASVHDAGWAHRDLKPANILLEKQSPLLADLGLTMSVEAATEDRLTGSNEAVGSRLSSRPRMNPDSMKSRISGRPTSTLSRKLPGRPWWAKLRPPVRANWIQVAVLSTR